MLIPVTKMIDFLFGLHLIKCVVDPVTAAAGISAGASLVGGLISAKQRKKERKAAARIAEAGEISKAGREKQKALSGIIESFRASLIR